MGKNASLWNKNINIQLKKLKKEQNTPKEIRREK